MLPANLVRVRFHRDRIMPRFLDPGESAMEGVAASLIARFRGAVGRTRADLLAELDELPGDPDHQFVLRGLASILEDRCEFAVVSSCPPEQLRQAALELASRARASGRFDRDEVVATAAAQCGVSVDELEDGLFADLKGQQRLTAFDDTTPERLIHRYNLALAQGLLLKAVRVEVMIRGESAARLRSILRRIKFQRLICTPTAAGPDACRLELDGPLSLFTATPKYGFQLASFLGVLVPCRHFELRAELRWGPQRKPKSFELTHEDGLRTDAPDSASREPDELTMFEQSFAKKARDWRLSAASAMLPLGESFWVPDYRLEHRPTGKTVYLEVLGSWRKSGAEQHLERLRAHATEPFVVAVSDRLRLDSGNDGDIPSGLVRFGRVPLVEDIIRAARAAADRENQRS